MPACISSTALATVLSLLCGACVAEDSPTPYGRGSHAIETQLIDWHDDARDRDVPVKIYLPKDVDTRAPVVVFSHGLGGSRNGYVYLGEQWAGRGYISVHLQHIGSDDSVFRDGGGLQGLQRAASNPMNGINRIKDVTFALNQLDKANVDDGPLKGRLDLKRIGMAGHSYGAFTTMAVAGQKFTSIGNVQFSGADPRIKAAIAMSSPVRRRGVAFDKAYGSIRIPVLHMTGTLDDSPVGESPSSDRRIPFDNTPGPNQFLITFTGGDHMVFSGRVRLPAGVNLPIKGMSGDGKLDAGFQEIIGEATTAFWDAYLRDDETAKKWLTDGELKKRLGKQGVLEKK